VKFHFDCNLDFEMDLPDNILDDSHIIAFKALSGYFEHLSLGKGYKEYFKNVQGDINLTRINEDA
jgi:hypothetical protein